MDSKVNNSEVSKFYKEVLFNKANDYRCTYCKCVIRAGESHIPIKPLVNGIAKCKIIDM